MTVEIDGGEPFEGHLQDLSVGGAFVAAEASPKVGTKLGLTVDMPDGKPLVVDATVRWTKPDGLGVQFGLMGVRETYAVTELLAGLEPIPDSRRPPAT